MVLGLHDDGDEDGWPQLLEQDVGEGLKHGIRHEEDGQTRIVSANTQAKVLSEACDFGVTNVGPVKEGEEVEEAELRGGRCQSF